MAKRERGRKLMKAPSLSLKYRICLRPDLPITLYEVLIGGKFSQRHGATCMHLLGGDSYFCSKAKLCAIGEGCGCIGVNASGVDHLLERGDGSGVIADDAFAMAGAIGGYVLEGVFEVAYRADAHFVVEKLCAIMFGRGLLEQG